jgi:hypothetical protein
MNCPKRVKTRVFSWKKHSTYTVNTADLITDFDRRIKLQKKDEKEESSAWMDMERHKLRAYEYLCHVGEAKQ